LNELEEERDHLLRSLDDLEREHDAGDVDDTDYQTLRDDYTARAAAVIRDIEAHRAGSAPKAPRAWGRTLGWTAAIIVFAVLTGVLVARMSGSRRDGETASGDVRENTRQLLADATTAAQRGEYDDAIDLYTEALDLAPSNAEALTYRGWARYQQGEDQAGAMADLDAAVVADGSYPDARVFRAILLVDQDDFAGAAAEMEVFDSLEPPPFMLQIVRSQALRERIVAGVLLAEGAPSFTDAGFEPAEVILAATYLADGLASPKPADALRLLDLVLAANPSAADALAYKGYVLVRVGDQTDSQQLIDGGLAQLDAALAVDPQHAPALVYRAFTLMFLYDDAAGAKVSLDAFDVLAEKPEDLVSLVDEFGLRDAISEALQG
jgi:tetratricopeptide (TPR) repeat protein